MNKELLIQLYKISSPSNKEDEMRAFIINELSNTEAYGNVSVEEKDGNLYVSKGCGDESVPCVAAHLDQVQVTKVTDIIELDGCLYGFNTETHSQVGLGADDKNGIWCALQLLKEFDNLKVAFFKAEEEGCIGSAMADLEFFKNVRYIIQIDRRNKEDLITSISETDLCSEDFKKDLLPIAEQFNYKETEGFATDVLILVKRGVGVSCINVSCGYYNPHQNTEYTILSELENCYNFVKTICQLSNIYPHTYVAPPVSSYYSPDFMYNDDYYYYDDYYETNWRQTPYFKHSNPSIKNQKSLFSKKTVTPEYEVWNDDFQNLMVQMYSDEDVFMLDIVEYYSKYKAKYPHLLFKDYYLAQSIVLNNLNVPY